MNNIWLSLEILPYCTLVCTKTFSNEKSCPNRLNPHSILVSHSLYRLGVFLLRLDFMLVHHRVTPQALNSPKPILYTLVKRGTVRVKCLAQEHNTVTPARAGTRTTRSGV